MEVRYQLRYSPAAVTAPQVSHNPRARRAHIRLASLRVRRRRVRAPPDPTRPGATPPCPASSTPQPPLGRPPRIAQRPRATPSSVRPPHRSTRACAAPTSVPPSDARVLGRAPQRRDVPTSLSRSAPPAATSSPRRQVARAPRRRTRRRRVRVILPDADVDLAQPGVEREGDAGGVRHRLTGVARPGEVGRHDGHRALDDEVFRHGLDLHAADVVQRDVPLPLPHPGVVVRGAPVTQQDETAPHSRVGCARRPRAPARAARSSGSRATTARARSTRAPPRAGRARRSRRSRGAPSAPRAPPRGGWAWHRP